MSLTNPNGDDGALLLTISGGPVDSVEAVGYPLYSARTDANTVRLIVTGDVRSGAVARIHIPDARQVSRYVASVTQVAVRSTFAQRDTSGYAISLVP